MKRPGSGLAGIDVILQLYRSSWEYLLLCLRPLCCPFLPLPERPM